jgi:hypothetical protein
MKSLNSDFIDTAETVNIWVFLACVLIAVACMFPEALIEASEFNVWLSLQANVAMVMLCVLWLTTQTAWILVRKFAYRPGTVSKA